MQSNEGPNKARLPNWDPWLIFSAWLAASAGMIVLSVNSIRERLWPDPDDPLRLQEVRDWLSGQSWFDVSQYRMNPPQGVPMHWSRLVDIPIAAVMLLVRPFLGADRAELAAIVLVPLVTLGVVTLLVALLARRLLDRQGVLLAAATMPFSASALQQMRPLRIDHHGWQIAAGLIATIGVLDDQPKRGALIAAAAMAVWLNISLEGLPFGTALAGLFAVRWILDRSECTRLRWYTVGLAGFSIILFATTHTLSGWEEKFRDAMMPAHLAGISAAALVTFLGARTGVRSRTLRVAILGCAGSVALLSMYSVDSGFYHGPFSQLDPIVRKFWYDRVDEGLPVWRLSFLTAFVAVVQPILGLVGAIVLYRHERVPTLRERKAEYLFLVLVSCVMSLFLLRSSSFALVLALPGLAYIGLKALRRARQLPTPAVRIPATIAAASIMFPTYIAATLFLIPSITDGTRAQTPPIDYAAARICDSRSELDQLNRLPVGRIAAPLDLGPAIIVQTRDTVIASGHHRNLIGMRDNIWLFLLPPQEAKKIVQERQIDYVVTCRGMRELRSYAAASPNGLASRLGVGQPPAWLELIRLPELRGLQIWRVRKDLLRAP